MPKIESFGRITKLPEDKLLYVNNWLARGGEVMALARHIQQQWNVWRDVNERTLCQQLNRYKKHLLTSNAPDLPEMRNEHGALVVKATRTRNIDPMERMVALLEIQEQRIQMFLNKEAQVQMPLKGVDDVIGHTQNLLKDIQKLRFELGMDEFKGPVQGMIRGASQTVRNPDGSSTTSTLFEALSMATQALDRAAIPSNLHMLGRAVDGVVDQ